MNMNLKEIWTKYKWWIVVGAVLLVVLFSCGNAQAQSCPTMTDQQQLEKLDKAVKDKTFAFAAVFKITEGGPEGHSMHMIITDKSGMMVGFYFVNGCMMPFPNTDQMMMPFRIADNIAELQKGELVFEAGDVRNALEIPGKPGQGA